MYGIKAICLLLVCFCIVSLIFILALAAPGGANLPDLFVTECNSVTQLPQVLSLSVKHTHTYTHTHQK